MSRRKQEKPPLSPGQVESRVREAMGQPKYGYPKAKYKTTRRLKCNQCKKTWKFSDKLNYSPCPSCKKGRLS